MQRRDSQAKLSLKVRFTSYTPWRHTQKSNAQHHSVLTSALNGHKWSISRPGRFTPLTEHRYTLYRRLGGHQNESGRFGEEGNISPPTGIRSPHRSARNRVTLLHRSYDELFLTQTHLCTAKLYIIPERMCTLLFITSLREQ
jgi:hypothetical protein